MDASSAGRAVQHKSHITLSFVVPAFNMEVYLGRCVDSLLMAKDSSDIEIIVIDDGSSDGTAAIADGYARRIPSVIRVLHQSNKGHGGAVNAGVALARGQYVKVVDADDWVSPGSLERVMAVLRSECGRSEPVDLLVTDYVYDKVGRRHKHIVRFDRVMKSDTRLGWDDLGRFGLSQYLIMHSIIFRTEVLRRARLRLPEHTFYVDFIYAYEPLPYVKTLMYVDTPFYHYFIGREGQSVQTNAMIARTDQLVRVNHAMTLDTPEPDSVPDGLYHYMIHFLSITSVVTSVFLILSRRPVNYMIKDGLWKDIDMMSPRIGHDVRRTLASRAINLPGRGGRFIIRYGYRVADRLVGFN